MTEIHILTDAGEAFHAWEMPAVFGEPSGGMKLFGWFSSRANALLAVRAGTRRVSEAFTAPEEIKKGWGP